MIGPAVQFEDLQQLTGYQRQSDVEECLKRQGIRFFYGRRGIWTTMEALNAALGVRQPAANAEPYRPEEVL